MIYQLEWLLCRECCSENIIWITVDRDSRVAITVEIRQFQSVKLATCLRIFFALEMPPLSDGQTLDKIPPSVRYQAVQLVPLGSDRYHHLSRLSTSQTRQSKSLLNSLYFRWGSTLDFMQPLNNIITLDLATISVSNILPSRFSFNHYYHHITWRNTIHKSHKKHV